MLQISKLADYGTVVMVYIAQHANLLCNARDIAKHTYIKLPTVSKLLKKLTVAGLLTSVRGVLGGYQLNREAHHISVVDIVYALDNVQGLTECSRQINACVIQHVCQVQNNWRLISQAVETALANISLAMLAAPLTPTIKVESITSVIDFGVNYGER